MSGIFGGGGSGDAGARAAEAQAAANRAATAELRRQFGVTQGLLEPFRAAGERGISTLEEASTVEGLDARLQKIFGTETFGGLVEERGRAVEGQLAASGQTRSGTGLAEAARVPTDLGLAIEGLLTGRTQDIVTGGQNAALGVAGFGSQNSQSIANILQRTGSAQGQGIITDQQAAAQRGQNTLNTVAALGSIFFSDPSLKENAEEIGEIGDLKIYEWDWIDRVKGTIIEKMSNMGFMANEVKAKYPQFVQEVCGFLAIDIPSLLDHLEANA